MELEPTHVESEHLHPSTLFGGDVATLWQIYTDHPDLNDEYAKRTLATVSIWSLDADRTYAHVVCSDGFAWSEETIAALLYYLATEVHGSGRTITDTFSAEVSVGSTVRAPSGRSVWWREDFHEHGE